MRLLEHNDSDNEEQHNASDSDNGDQVDTDDDVASVDNDNTKGEEDYNTDDADEDDADADADEEDGEDGEEDEESIIGMAKQASNAESRNVDTENDDGSDADDTDDGDDDIDDENDMQISGVMGNDDEYDDEDDEDPDTYLQKFDEEINNNYLLDHHPEHFNKNYDEIETLCNIVRDVYNNIVDPLHNTIPYLTKYERARVLGQRAKQINSGSKAYVQVPDNILDGYVIAQMELVQRRIPFIIQRPMFGGKMEYWKLKDLEIL